MTEDKGYSIWVCGNCHAKFFIDKKPSYCPCCRSTKQLGCGGYVQLGFEKNMELDNGYIKDLEGEQDEDN